MFESASASGDETRSDFGRVVFVVLGAPGVGDGVFLAKGLLREFRAKGRPFGAGALIVVDSDSDTGWRQVRRDYLPMLRGM